MPGNLFHYTDATAVKSILEKCELWLSDIRFLNDTQEMNDGVRYIIEELDADLSSDKLNFGYVMYARDFLKEAFEDHISLYIDDEPTFVCSFSESGDQLSQWRAYGNYAIEFDKDVIFSELDLFHCLYEEPEKRKYAADMVHQAIEGLVADLVANDGAFSPRHVDYLSLLVRTASIFKDRSFYEEREVRCAIDINLPSDDLKFRSRGGLLIPYVTLGFPLDAIKAIHIGPMRDQELAYTSMKALVAMVTHKYLSDGNVYERDIEVIMSKVPYRAPS